MIVEIDQKGEAYGGNDGLQFDVLVGWLIYYTNYTLLLILRKNGPGISKFFCIFPNYYFQNKSTSFPSTVGHSCLIIWLSLLVGLFIYLFVCFLLEDAQ